MSTKKYMSLDRMQEYDTLIKQKIASGDDAALTSAKEYANTELTKKQDALTFDSIPTEGSDNPVTSDGVATAISDVRSSIPKLPTVTSSNAGQVLTVNEEGSWSATTIDVYSKAEVDAAIAAAIGAAIGGSY